MRVSKLSILLLAFLLVILSACGDTEEASNQEDENVNTEENEEAEETNPDDQDQQETEEDNEVSFEVQDASAPEDQGDLNVWFDGDIVVEGNTITAKGTTNLLPDSRLSLKIDSVEGTIIGGSGQGTVESSGAFEIESNVPDEFEGLLEIELTFESGAQYDELREHYTEGITGNFKRIYYDSYDDAVYTKAAFHHTIMFNGETQEIAITEPEWDIPEDLGSPTVWMEPTVEKLEDYVVINVKSNLVEGAFIRAQAIIPNYITTGFVGSSYINPDGSATLYIKDPEKDSRIENMEKYDIHVEVTPSHGNNGKQVIEAYGEQGEKLAGDLAYHKSDSEGKAINQKITITVK